MATTKQTRKKNRETPSIEQLKAESKRIKHKKRYIAVLKSTIFTLLISAACAVLIATIFLPVLQIYGTSMAPTLNEGEVVISLKITNFKVGDLVSFYVGNKLLVKRYIAGPGQCVNIDENGNVYVDDVLLDEPYISEKALGNCNIEFPYQVPENRFFVLGDHRTSSIDSRNTAVGCIDEDQVVGKIVFRVWPLERLGSID